MKRPLLLFVALLTVTSLAFGRGRIQFDKQRYAVSAGESIVIKYELPKEGKVNVKTSGGWTAEVIPNGGRHGSIKVTAPDPATAPDLKVFAVIPGEDDAFARLNVMVKDPYTEATRPKANLQIWGGLSEFNTTQEDYNKAAEAGFTIITLEGGEAMDMDGDGTISDEDMLATIRFKLDLIRNAGLKYTLHHPWHPGVLEMVKDDPNCLMVHIFDEPGLWQIPQLKQRKAWVKQYAPEKPVHINLHPEASIRAMGTDSYRNYIQSMVDGCDMEILSYDQYPIMADKTIMNYWYKCMEINSNIARKKGIPFWAFTASCYMEDEHRYMPDMANMRLQVYTDFAYGAEVVQYFVYRGYAVATLAPITSEGKYTKLYDLMKEFNAEMHKRGFVFNGGKVTKTRFTHLTPWNCLPLLASDLPEEIASIDSDRTALVGFEENNGNDYLVVVNSDCFSKCKVSVDFTQLCYTIDRTGAFTEQQPGKRDFVLDEGDMLVIKYR